jgi:hypothetical protein
VEPVALRPLRVGEILDVAIKLYRANFRTLVKAVVVVVGPVQVLSALVSSSTRSFSNSRLTTTVGADGQVHLKAGAVGGVVAGGLILVALGLVATELASAASLRAVSEAYLGEQPEWRRSLRFAVSRLRPLIWLAFIHFLLIAVGFLFCVVPGVYFYGAFAVAVPVLLLEDVRGRRALGRSRDLVRGRWWPVAGAVFVATLLTSIVQSAVSAGLVGASLSANNEIVRDVVAAIGGTAAAMITTPFLAAVIVVLYIDLRVRKEGFDLELLAHRVGVEPTPGAAPLPFLPEPPPVVVDGDEPPFWPPPPGWRPRSDS